MSSVPASGRRPSVALGAALAGVGLAVGVLVLGEIATTGAVAGLDLRVDEYVAAHDRTGWLTWLAEAVTQTATPETVGLALTIGLPVILLLARRRADAARVLCVFAGALVLAEAAKQLIGEHRPPASVRLMAADSSPSFPSGHTTVAAALAVSLILIAGTAAWRYAAITAGALYVVAVAASRVYLGDHYPLDVLGSVLCALAAALIVTAPRASAGKAVHNGGS